MLKQQSLAEFLGLHLDIDAIKRKNETSFGTKKHGILVNEGDKLTREDLEEKKRKNQARFGLTAEQVEGIKLPRPTAVRIYDIKKILNPKNDLSTIDKINHLLDLEKEL